MHKIYTITFQRALNNGAVLQAYALMKFLKNNKFDVEVLDYAPSYFLMQTYRPAKGIKKTIEKFKKFKKFKKFRQDFMTLTPKTYYTFNQLAYLPKADTIICGSDQIWNENLTGGKIDPTYYLDFAASNAKRVAYAASAGSIRIKKLKVCGEYLAKFDSIGTRETVLAEDVKSLVPNSNPEVVVDPCLLISDYDEVLDFSRLPEGDFIVSYVVGSGEMLEKFNQKVMHIKSKTDLPIIHIGAKAIDAADDNILDIGPSDWAAFIKNAKHVVTNSFHGVAFCINFETNFVFIPQIIDNLNSRQTTLLKGVNLMSRMVSHDDNSSLVLFDEIDYEPVSENLSILVSKSQSFLLRSIS